MIGAFILLVGCFLGCYAPFESTRHGPRRGTGMFGERTQYLDGSIGVELELDVALYGKGRKALKSGVAYATASIGDRPLWMLQVDIEAPKMLHHIRVGGSMIELVSHVIDGRDTESLLILEHSMNLLLKQFAAATTETALRTIVDNYNGAVRRTNDDRDWKIMKMPDLRIDSKLGNMYVQYFGWMQRSELSPQVNFGVPVETFTLDRIDQFLTRSGGSETGPFATNYDYLTQAVTMADKWANLASTPNMQFTAEETGILALTIAKTLGKQAYFDKSQFWYRGPKYDAISDNANHISDLTESAHMEYKNHWGILPKVNLRELISAKPNNALRRFLDNPRLVLEGEERQMYPTEKVAVADIDWLMSREISASPVDDDCFVDADRVFPSQRHSGNRLAIVMETRYEILHSVQMFPGFLTETRSTVESTRRYQSLFGDLRADSDLRVFQDFELALATTKLPRYRRVTLDFGELGADKIERYVMPFAKDTEFATSFRRLAGIQSIVYMNRGEKVASDGYVLAINVDRVTDAADIWKSVKSHINEHSQSILRQRFERMVELARKYNVKCPNGALNFDQLERFRSHFLSKIYKRLMNGRFTTIGVTDSSCPAAKWANLHGVKQGRQEDGFDFGFEGLVGLPDDVKRTLDMWVDMYLNLNEIEGYHSDDKLLRAKFSLIEQKTEDRARQQKCSI